MGSSLSAPMPTVSSGPLSSFPRHRAPSFGLQDPEPPEFESRLRQDAIAKMRAELKHAELVKEASLTSWFSCLPPSPRQMMRAQERLDKNSRRHGCATP